MTKLCVVKWGDSMAVRLPKDFAQQHGLAVGDDIRFAYQLPSGEWRKTGGARSTKVTDRRVGATGKSLDESKK